MGPDLSGDRAGVDALAELRGRRWLLVGIGNDLRGDDAFGPLLARRLAGMGRPAIDAGTAPENVTGHILRAAPEVLILADAAVLGAEPGATRLLDVEALAEGGTSTHDPSFRMLLSYLEARGRGPEPMSVKILACEPATRALGAPTSPAVLDAVERLARALGGR